MEHYDPYDELRVFDYDPAWEEQYKAHAEAMRRILGANVVSTEHVGETSVEGMPAHMRVDVLVVVKDLALVANMHQAFMDAGYNPRGRQSSMPEAEFVTKQNDAGQRLANIYIFNEGDPSISDVRLFRDYFSSHPEDKELYSSVVKDVYAETPEKHEGIETPATKMFGEIQERMKVWGAQQSKS